jgi:indole-3-glycerol phosphate synthase
MKLKICGITNEKDLEICCKYADAVGFIVDYPPSPRSISVKKAKELLGLVPPFTSRVVVIPDFKKAMKICSELKPEIVQLHGEETIPQVENFRKKIGCKIIKACSYKDAISFSKCVDAVLIDDKYSPYDLNKVNEIIKNVDKPVILAGHITPDNISDILKINPYAIDVASGVEAEPGRKSLEKIRKLRKRIDTGTLVGRIIKNKNLKPFNFYKKLKGKDLKIIAEIKPASPSSGKLREVCDLRDIIKSIEKGGASALSVLVEEEFGGSLLLLSKVRKLTSLPILAKGFFSSPNEIANVAKAGADAFLLMSRIAEPEELLRKGEALGLDAVVEVANANELEEAMKLGANIIEINNRDIYGDLCIDFEKALLGSNLPEDILFISASGIGCVRDLQKLYDISRKRINAFLVGTSIMKSKNVQAKVEELVKGCEKVKS